MASRLFACRTENAVPRYADLEQSRRLQRALRQFYAVLFQ